MANMLDEQRVEVWAAIMKAASSEREDVPLLKADIRAAVDAIDAWISDNTAGMKAAIPEPAKTALTNAQKARLFMFVVRKRYDVGV